MASAPKSAAIITPEEFERAIAPLVHKKEFQNSDFDQIAHLLCLYNRPQWAIRPRTYTVLRLIDRVDLIHGFVAEGLKDISLPYTITSLPPVITTPGARFGFLDKQKLVLTKASELEDIHGHHRHFDNSVDSHFEYVRLLGRGISGEVHHVRSKLSREEYAWKRIPRRKLFIPNDSHLIAYENEISNLKRLSHHHLIKLIGSYTDPHFIGLLLSPVAECDLRTFLDRKPFPQEDFDVLRGFYGCLCSALAYLHSRECRHKDLKPENIVIKNQNPMITDFGTARDWSDQSRSTTDGLPSPHTPWYAAPEVLDFDERGSSADVWSLGCIFVDISLALHQTSRADLRLFLTEHGTESEIPAFNAEAMSSWVAKIWLDDLTNEPMRWIPDMLKLDRTTRVSAATLLGRIRNSPPGQRYCGSCCEEDGNTGSISHDDFAPPRTHVVPSQKVLSKSRPHPSAVDCAKGTQYTALTRRAPLLESERAHSSSVDNKDVSKSIDSQVFLQPQDDHTARPTSQEDRPRSAHVVPDQIHRVQWPHPSMVNWAKATDYNLPTQPAPSGKTRTPPIQNKKDSESINNQNLLQFRGDHTSQRKSLFASGGPFSSFIKRVSHYLGFAERSKSKVKRKP
ncbi:MAG: hypothetical protein M1814_001317 [Vezdaea aestivalis]|nr:MAG: hypothetical protein M1814_001317 [Vezdaea aestivalis]